MTSAEEAPDETGPSEIEAPPASAAGRRRSSATLIATVAAAVFAVSTVLLAIVAVGLKSDQDSDRSDRAEVSRVAGEFSQALSDVVPERVLALSSGAFRTQFEDALPEIQSGRAALGRTTVTTVDEIFVAELEGGEATVIVVYDAVESLAQQEPVLARNIYLRLGMVRIEGEWRVDSVINLNFASSEAVRAESTATTDTGPTTSVTSPADGG